MSNEVTPHEPEPFDDDGFGGSLVGGRLIKGSLLKWTDSLHWVDCDGVVPPSPLLVIAINEALQKWKNNKPEIISKKPLPDPEVLNAVIPKSEWELGRDGKPRPPWQHVAIVYLVNLTTGEFLTYLNSTIGAHIAFDHLKEAVITMRALRGRKCVPLVNLAEKPWETSYGKRIRPHFEIVDWKTPGDGTKAVSPKPTPQLIGPAAAPTPAPTAAPTPAPAAPPAPAAKPAQLRQSKPSLPLTDYTLAVMGEVKPVTTEELLNDSLDDLPWDHR